jgi:hypothetical protein
VDEEHAEEGVATFGDAAEALAVGAGVFAGSEAEEAGEVPGRGEAVEVTYEGDDAGGGEETGAWDGEQAGDGRELIGELVEGAFELVEALFELTDFGSELAGFPRPIKSPALVPLWS